MKVEQVKFAPDGDGAPEAPSFVCIGYSFECGLWFSGVGKSEKDAWLDISEVAAGNGEIDRSTLKMFRIEL